MTDRLEEVYEKYVKPLPTGERLRLLEMTAHDLALTTPLASPKRSILELRGLGKEIWQGIDAQTYVDGLREEWDPTGRRLGRGDDVGIGYVPHHLFNRNASMPVNAEVAGYAADLRAQYELRTPDALQIAAAKTANCQVFLTNDKALKRVEAVRVLVLNELEFKPVISD